MVRVFEQQRQNRIYTIPNFVLKLVYSVTVIYKRVQMYQLLFYITFKNGLYNVCVFMDVCPLK